MDLEKRSINGRYYQFYYLPSKKAIKLLVRGLKIIGGGLGKGLSSVSDVKSLLDKEINYGALIEGLLNRIDEDFVLTFISDFLEHVEVEAGEDRFKKVDLNMDFQGKKLGDLFLVLKEAIVINYADFFGGVSGAMKDLPGTEKKV